MFKNNIPNQAPSVFRMRSKALDVLPGSQACNNSMHKLRKKQKITITRASYLLETNFDRPNQQYATAPKGMNPQMLRSTSIKKD
jgi:hypothetical protein